MRRARRASANKGWTVARLGPAGRVSIRMRIPALFLLMLLSAPVLVSAQQQRLSPRLQQRQQALAEDGIFRPGRSNIPDGAAGSYALSPDSAEVIEIILNGDGDSVRLQGYLTRMGDGTSDRGAPLTYFFARTAGSWKSTPRASLALVVAAKSRSATAILRRPFVKSNNWSPTIA